MIRLLRRCLSYVSATPVPFSWLSFHMQDTNSDYVRYVTYGLSGCDRLTRASSFCKSSARDTLFVRRYRTRVSCSKSVIVPITCEGEVTVHYYPLAGNDYNTQLPPACSLSAKTSLILEQAPRAFIELLIVNSLALGDVQHIFAILFVFLQLQLINDVISWQRHLKGVCARKGAKFKQSILYTFAFGYFSSGVTLRMELVTTSHISWLKNAPKP
jgi:hypothetical protein